jgi:PAS domain S-box-containing protein
MLQYTPVFLSTGLIVLLCLLIFWTTWQQRNLPGARPLAALIVATAWWIIGATLEEAVLSPSLKIIWSKLQYFSIESAPVLWLIFALEYSRLMEHLSEQVRRGLPLLWVVPVITLCLVFTNEKHWLIWSQITSQGAFLHYDHGLGFWIAAAYNYLLMIGGMLALLWMIRHSIGVNRAQTAIIIIGAIFPFIGNALYLLRLTPVEVGDLTPNALMVTCILYAWGILRYRLFDLVPVARDTLVDRMADGMLVLDNQERVLYINPAAEKLLHLQFSDTPDQAQIIPGIRADQAFSSHPDLLQSIRDSQSSDHQIQDASSQSIYLRLNIDPLNDRDGNTAGKMVLIQDITSLKVSEERFRSDEERLRLQSAALESAATGVLITDINGVILWVNPAFTTITGFSAQEAIGKNPRILNSGTHDLQFFTQLWKTILAGQIWQHETINRRKDGRIYVEEQTIAPVRDASGQISHFISTKQDITQRKQLEELRDELMHTIVHDLRNPLTSMLASLDMLEYWREQLQLEKEPVQILQIARTSAWRMLGLVNTILDLYKLESGKMQLKREPLVLTPLVEQIFRIESPLAIRREVLLLNNIPFDLPVLNLDQLLIGRVIQNLIDNALRYTPDGGNVEVSACYDPHQRVIILSVHDQGPGVPPEAQSRLFQKFVSSSKERGTGLGLAFCRLAVEAHNGRIWAESEPGQGTTFLVSLPLDEISTQESIV